MPQTEITLSDILKNRAGTYQLLSRLFLKEVDEELLKKLCDMRFPRNTGNAKVDEGYRLIRDYLNHADMNAVNTLAVDYTRTFLGSGVSGYSAAYPFESVYTSPKRLMMQDARDEMLALYRAVGLGKADDFKEAEDHVGVEMEYMAILGERTRENYGKGDEDAAISLLVAQRNFLEDHLLAWFPMMAKDMETFPKTNFYLGLGKLAWGFLESDKELLDDLLDGVEFEDGSAEAREQTLAEKADGADGPDESDDNDE